jgi:hypothetical protein
MVASVAGDSDSGEDVAEGLGVVVTEDEQDARIMEKNSNSKL